MSEISGQHFSPETLRPKVLKFSFEPIVHSNPQMICQDLLPAFNDSFNCNSRAKICQGENTPQRGHYNQANIDLTSQPEYWLNKPESEESSEHFVSFDEEEECTDEDLLQKKQDKANTGQLRQLIRMSKPDIPWQIVNQRITQVSFFSFTKESMQTSERSYSLSFPKHKSSLQSLVPKRWKQHQESLHLYSPLDSLKATESKNQKSNSAIFVQEKFSTSEASSPFQEIHTAQTGKRVYIEELESGAELEIYDLHSQRFYGGNIQCSQIDEVRPSLEVDQSERNTFNSLGAQPLRNLHSNSTRQDNSNQKKGFDMTQSIKEIEELNFSEELEKQLFDSEFSDEEEEGSGYSSVREQNERVDFSANDSLDDIIKKYAKKENNSRKSNPVDPQPQATQDPLES